MGRDIEHILDNMLETVPFMNATEVLSDRREGDPSHFIYVYILLGLFFAWLAKRRLRREVF